MYRGIAAVRIWVPRRFHTAVDPLQCGHRRAYLRRRDMIYKLCARPALRAHRPLWLTRPARSSPASPQSPCAARCASPPKAAPPRALTGTGLVSGSRMQVCCDRIHRRFQCADGGAASGVVVFYPSRQAGGGATGPCARKHRHARHKAGFWRGAHGRHTAGSTKDANRHVRRGLCHLLG